MKIKSLGYTSVKLSFPQVDVLVDPVAAKAFTKSFPKTSGDVVLFTENKYVEKDNVLETEGLSAKVEPSNREGVLEIVNPGEYEIGEVFIRRDMGTNFYVLDQGDIRVVVVGLESKEIPLEKFKNLGDVDLLVIPAGNGEDFMSYEKLGKLIPMADPTYLIPVGFGGGKGELKGSEEFIKHFGYTHVSEESTLRVKKGKEVDSKIMQVVILK